MGELKSIKVPNIIYGEESRSNSLKAYKAENELKRAVIQHKDTIQDYLYKQHNIPSNFRLKSPESLEKEEYSLVDLINSKLTNSSISVCLNTYETYKEQGIEIAIEKLHLQSNLMII